MQLAAQTTIAACELALLDIHAAGKSEPLRVPTRARGTTVGGEAALAQLIITWAQRASEPHLQTFVDSMDDEQITTLSRRLYGIVGAMCSSRITGRSDQLDITQRLRGAALAEVDGRQGVNPRSATRGPSTEIICVDHIGRGSPETLYRRDPSGSRRIRPRPDYRALAQQLINGTLPNSYSKVLDGGAAEAIGGLLYELFMNTEDHALRDLEGNKLPISIRAVKTVHHSPNKSTLQELVADYDPLNRYCNNFTPREGASQVHFFELSVLDSGPGFAQTFTRRPLSSLSDAEEIAAVNDCFSTRSSKRQLGYGQGLPHVVRLMRRERGFLRLRTGRLSLFADLSLPPPSESGTLTLERWVPEDSRAVAPVSGTLLTLLLPLRLTA